MSFFPREAVDKSGYINRITSKKSETNRDPEIPDDFIHVVMVALKMRV